MQTISLRCVIVLLCRCQSTEWSDVQHTQTVKAVCMHGIHIADGVHSRKGNFYFTMFAMIVIAVYMHSDRSCQAMCCRVFLLFLFFMMLLFNLECFHNIIVSTGICFTFVTEICIALINILN